jgi:hypothetical protein
LNVNHSQQGASSSGILPWEADSISQPREGEETIGGRGSPVVRNPPTLYEVTSLGASSSDISPQRAGESSKPVDWEPIVLAFPNRELVVPANLRTRVTFCMQPLSRPKQKKRSFPIDGEDRHYSQVGHSLHWRSSLLVIDR